MTDPKTKRVPEMVEQVAKALIDRIGSPWPYEKMDPMIQRLWHGHARAAIAAMRLPTDAMLAGAVRWFKADGEDLPFDEQDAAVIYTAAIDEALR